MRTDHNLDALRSEGSLLSAEFIQKQSKRVPRADGYGYATIKTAPALPSLLYLPALKGGVSREI